MSRGVIIAALMGGVGLGLVGEVQAEEPGRNPFWFDKCDVFQLKDAERLRAVRADVQAYFAAHPSTETVPTHSLPREMVLILADGSTWSVVMEGQGLCSAADQMCVPTPAAWVPPERRPPDADLRDPVEWALSESSETATWRTYEDALLRFSYPPTWDVPRATLTITIGQKGQARAPTRTEIQVNWPMEPGNPGFHIKRSPMRESAETLSTRATYRVGHWHTLGWHLLAGVEHPQVSGPEACVLHAMETPRSVSEKASGELWECHRAVMELECRSPGGDLVFVAGLPSHYSESKAVGPEDGPVREQLALFKRLLCGLKFR